MRNFYMKSFALLVCFVITTIMYTSIPVTWFDKKTREKFIRVAPSTFYHVTVLRNGNYDVYRESDLKTAMMKNCSFASSLNDLDGVRLPNNEVVDIKTYKKMKKDEFIRLKANPATKTLVRPTVQTFDSNATANPTGRLRDPKEEINKTSNILQMLEERKRSLELGDTDLLQIPEVVQEMKQTDYKVPNLVHFIWFSCNPFRVDHYMALMGALRYQRPKLILFHTDCEPQGHYWDAFKVIAGNNLKVVKKTPPKQIWGLKIEVVEHQADVARLNLMLEVGGIYMDTDSVILKNLDKFRKFEMVLGQETEDAVANGIILANRDSWFLHRWYWEYKYFKDNIWGHNSVLVPWGIWKYFPKTIHIESNTFCRPNWGELTLLYYELMDWSRSYIMHLYTRFMPSYEGKRERPLKELAILNTTFGEVARHVIWGSSEIRDITNWIETCDIKEILIKAKP